MILLEKYASTLFFNVCMHITVHKCYDHLDHDSTLSPCYFGFNRYIQFCGSCLVIA